MHVGVAIGVRSDQLVIAKGHARTLYRQPMNDPDAFQTMVDPFASWRYLPRDARRPHQYSRETHQTTLATPIYRLANGRATTSCVNVPRQNVFPTSRRKPISRSCKNRRAMLLPL